MNPSTWTHTISYQLEIVAGNKILVPGAEPTSALSSPTLNAYLAKHGFKHALVKVEDALAAIPGSTIKFGRNFSRSGVRQKWFVLPPIKPDCPCSPYDDYYQILRDLANEELPIVESYDSCDLNNMGFCPSPDFNLTPAPSPSPYVEPGTFPSGTGILPPLPPWQN